MESLRMTDDQSKAVQKTPNRISLDSILAKIGKEYAFTLRDCLEAQGLPSFSGSEAMTISIVVMANGFVVIGKSSPADPANFDAEICRKFAREDAIRQIWPLEAYALKEWLALGEATE